MKLLRHHNTILGVSLVGLAALSAGFLAQPNEPTTNGLTVTVNTPTPTPTPTLGVSESAPITAEPSITASSPAASQAGTPTSAGPKSSTTQSTSTPVTSPAQTASTAVASGGAAEKLFGKPRSGLPWHSGVWVGGRFNNATLNAFGDFRGRPVDFVTAYAYSDSFDKLVGDSWPITNWAGFEGKLNLGLGLIPKSGEASFDSVAAGHHDEVWRQVAVNLKNAGRGDSMIRLSWEYNLENWKWYTTTSNVEQFKAAYRRVAKVMKTEAPELKFEFGLGCGRGLNGSNDRLSSLTLGYPGDDVVDLVGCDTYDEWGTTAHDLESWNTKVLRNSGGPGIQDVVDFARAHGKGASFGEWGLSKTSNVNGGGDNTFYVEQMYKFFQANKDVIAMESYFDEPGSNMMNSIQTGQMPNAANTYKNLW